MLESECSDLVELYTPPSPVPGRDSYIYRPRTYVRREVMFSQVCLCSTFGGGRGGTPSQVWLGGDTPSQVWLGGVPHPRSTWGTPPDLGWGTSLDLGRGTPPELGWGNPPRQISVASTCYAAGGMPLAFTQEDFLVISFGH